MDANRFDRWTRARAAAANRRSFLGWSLATGTATALARFHSTTAQLGGTCTYAVTLTSTTTSGAIASGTLTIAIGTDGAIDTGSLTLQGQAAASVVGQAQGPAVELVADLEDGGLLSLIGVSKSDISTCSNPVFGSLANADSEQLGTWLATPGNAASGSGQVQPPPAVPTTTPTPAAAPVLASCDAPKMVCGANCCPAGADCLDTGACECPSGTEECGIACFPSCADGVTTLDPVTCLCPTG